MITCSVLPVTAVLHGHELTEHVLADLRELLGEGCEVVDDVEAASPTQPLAVLVVSGGTEAAVLDAWRRRRELVAGEPLVLISHPAHNSLPAALEALARLQHDGARARIVMMPTLHSSGDAPGDTPGDASLAAQEVASASHHLEEVLHDADTWHRLHRARLGLVGAPSEWLVASMPDAQRVRERWGVQVVDIDLPTVIDHFEDNIEAPIAVPVRLAARPHPCTPHPADVETAARLEPVLRAEVATHGLAAVAVRCFDLIEAEHTTGCLALSAVNDSGTIAGCEGDVASTLAMLWVKELTGHRSWMANPAGIDRTSGVIELAHCTVPLSMVSGYHLDTHFESGIGVGISGDLPAGPCTLLRLGGDGLEQLWCAEGEAIVTEPRQQRCRTQIDVAIAPAAAGELLDHPLGNHLVMVYGHHADHLTAWWRAHIA